MNPAVEIGSRSPALLVFRTLAQAPCACIIPSPCSAQGAVKAAPSASQRVGTESESPLGFTSPRASKIARIFSARFKSPTTVTQTNSPSNEKGKAGGGLLLFSCDSGHPGGPPACAAGYMRSHGLRQIRVSGHQRAPLPFPFSPGLFRSVFTNTSTRVTPSASPAPDLKHHRTSPVRTGPRFLDSSG